MKILILFFLLANSLFPRSYLNSSFIINSILNDTTKNQKEFVVDDYPISEFMLTSISPYDEIKSGALISDDRVWFKNDVLKQNIIIDLYTDLFRLNIFHFYTNDIPCEIINGIELNKSNGDFATYPEKRKDFNGFLEQAHSLPSNYLTSNKGFRLGDSKENILEHYPEPDSIKTINDIEVYIWNFFGDVFVNEIQKSNNRTIAKNSFGNTTKLYFKENKLIAVHIHNEIP